MCGRVRLSSDVSEIKLVFRIPPSRPTPNFPPRRRLRHGRTGTRRNRLGKARGAGRRRGPRDENLGWWLLNFRVRPPSRHSERLQSTSAIVPLRSLVAISGDGL
jgi:hypothetical protein